MDIFGIHKANLYIEYDRNSRPFSSMKYITAHKAQGKTLDNVTVIVEPGDKITKE